MTPVVFHFLTPDGEPLGNTDVEIQLTRSTFDDVESGVLMPRPLVATTNEDGKVTVPLQPGDLPYIVSVYDSASEAALSYKFYVPLLEAPNTEYRLQDLIVEGNLSTTPWDTEAVQLILQAKANAMASQSAAAESAEEAAEAQFKAESAAFTAVSMRDIVVPAKDTVLAAKEIVVAKASETETNAATATNAKIAAAASQAAALISEQAAKISETQSKISETNSAQSEVNSAASKIAAGNSEVAAISAKETAVTAATNSSNSAAAALQSEGNSKLSETNAATSASAALQSELKAAEYKASIQASEQNVSAFKVIAEQQAGIATTKAGEAAASATSAATSATNLSNAVNSANAAKADAEAAKTTAVTKAGEAVVSAEQSHQWAITAQAAAEGAVAGQMPSDWLATTGVSRILNKPVIPSTKADFGLGNVENKSSAMIRAEITASDVNTALSGELRILKAAVPQVILKDTDAGANLGQWAASVQNNGASFVIGSQDDAGTNTAKLSVTRAGNVKVSGPSFELDNTAAGSTTSISFSGLAGFARTLDFQTGTSKRWNIGTDTSGEAGGNGGTNFAINRYSDAGALVDTPMTISRASGITSFSGQVFINSGRMVVNSPASVSRLTFYMTGSSPRWITGATSGTETGNNASSDYVIGRYSDAGTYIDNAVLINRATGVMNLSVGIFTPSIQFSAVGNVARNADTVFYSSTDNEVRKNTASGIKNSLGLDQVNNTSDIAKPVSTATQAALDTKAPLNSPAFTGTVTGITAAMVGLTNVNNTSDANKPVSTATQTALNLKQSVADKDANNGYVGLTGYKINFKNALNSFTSTLANTNTAARSYVFPDKDGTVALMSDLANLSTAPIIDNGALPPGQHVINSNYTLTLPDLTQAVQLALSSSTNAVALPSKVTTFNGWTVDTGFTVGATKTIAPVKYGSAQGWWGSARMTPPVLATKNVSAAVNNSPNPIQILASGQSGNTMVFLLAQQATISGSNGYALLLMSVNVTTGAINNISRVDDMYANQSGYSSSTMYINAENSTVTVFSNNVQSNFVAYRYNLDGTFIDQIGNLNVSGNSAYMPTPVKLADGLYITASASGLRTIYNYNQMGTALNLIGSALLADAEFAVINATSCLMLTPNNASSIDTSCYAYILTVNPTNGAITAGEPFVAFPSVSSQYTKNAALIPLGNGLFLAGHGIAYGNTASHWRVLSVTNNVITGYAQLSSIPYSITNIRQQTGKFVANLHYWNLAAYFRQLAKIISPTQVLLTGALSVSGQVMMLTRGANNVLTLNTVSGASTNSTYQFISDKVTGNNTYLYNGASITPLLVVNNLPVIGTEIASKPTTIFTPTLNDAAQYIDGAWYAWATPGVPTAHAVISDTKYISFDDRINFKTYGGFQQ